MSPKAFFPGKTHSQGAEGLNVDVSGTIILPTCTKGGDRHQQQQLLTFILFASHFVPFTKVTICDT